MFKLMQKLQPISARILYPTSSQYETQTRDRVGGGQSSSEAANIRSNTFLK